MKNLTDLGGEYAAIIDFADKWKSEDVNEHLWNMFIETLSSEGAHAYDLGQMGMMVRDLQNLTQVVQTIHKIHNKDMGTSPSLN